MNQKSSVKNLIKVLKIFPWLQKVNYVNSAKKVDAAKDEVEDAIVSSDEVISELSNDKESNDKLLRKMKLFSAQINDVKEEFEKINEAKGNLAEIAAKNAANEVNVQVSPNPGIDEKIAEPEVDKKISVNEPVEGEKSTPDVDKKVSSQSINFSDYKKALIVKMFSAVESLEQKSDILIDEFSEIVETFKVPEVNKDNEMAITDKEVKDKFEKELKDVPMNKLTEGYIKLKEFSEELESDVKEVLESNDIDSKEIEKSFCDMKDALFCAVESKDAKDIDKAIDAVEEVKEKVENFCGKIKTFSGAKKMKFVIKKFSDIDQFVDEAIKAPERTYAKPVSLDSIYKEFCDDVESGKISKAKALDFCKKFSEYKEKLDDEAGLKEDTTVTAEDLEKAKADLAVAEKKVDSIADKLSDETKREFAKDAIKNICKVKDDEDATYDEIKEAFDSVSNFSEFLDEQINKEVSTDIPPKMDKPEVSNPKKMETKELDFGKENEDIDKMIDEAKDLSKDIKDEEQIKSFSEKLDELKSQKPDNEKDLTEKLDNVINILKDIKLKKNFADKVEKAKEVSKDDAKKSDEAKETKEDASTDKAKSDKIDDKDIVSFSQRATSAYSDIIRNLASL